MKLHLAFKPTVDKDYALGLTEDEFQEVIQLNDVQAAYWKHKAQYFVWPSLTLGIILVVIQLFINLPSIIFYPVAAIQWAALGVFCFLMSKAVQPIRVNIAMLDISIAKHHENICKLTAEMEAAYAKEEDSRA